MAKLPWTPWHKAVKLRRDPLLFPRVIDAQGFEEPPGFVLDEDIAQVEQDDLDAAHG